MEGASTVGIRMGGDDVRRTCTVDYCDRTPRSPTAELCEGHYGQRRRGKPFSPLKPRRIEGSKCAVEGCPKRRRGQFCSMHEARIRRHGDPAIAIHQSERDLPRGERHHGWVDEPNYRQWHQRLRNMNGSASLHECSKGCGRQARHWAYVGDSREHMAHSTDLSDYAPMCVSCHKRHDLDRISR